MHRETLGLFKTFEESHANRGLILSHFGFFSARFPMRRPEMVRVSEFLSFPPFASPLVGYSCFT